MEFLKSKQTVFFLPSIKQCNNTNCSHIAYSYNNMLSIWDGLKIVLLKL